MQDHGQHLSDDDLLLAADGEMEKCTNRVRRHLESCAHCRTRTTQMETILLDLRRAERRSLDPELPSIAGPRAALRTRLAALPSTSAGLFSRWHISGSSLTRALRLAVVTALIAVAGTLTFRYSVAKHADPRLLSSDYSILPNRAFTPGAARPASLTEVCSLPHEEVVKAVSPALRQRVFAEYGIPSAQSDKYEVDYLITPGLGGDDDIRNLWPQPYGAAIWNARAKDALEERLHELVCSHQLDLSVAQEAISTNWIAAYEKYVDAAPATTVNLKSIFS